MMQFRTPSRGRHGDGLLPLIDVVCVLLIFFLISARMAPPSPFAVELPQSNAEAEAKGEFALFLSPSGLPGFRQMEGEAALTALAQARDAVCTTTDCTATPPRLALHTDQKTPAKALARVMPRLGAMGFAQIELVTDKVAP